MKMLVMRLTSIGDVLLTTPVARCLKKQLPELELHYLTRGKNGELLKYNPYIDRLLLLDDNNDVTIDILQKEKYDYVVDLHNNHRTHRIRRALKVKCSVYRKENVRKFIYVWTKFDVMSGRNVVDRYLKAVENLGVIPDNGGLDLFLPPEFQYNSLLNQTVGEVHLADIINASYVAIACGGQHYTKRMPVEKVVELCSLVKHPVVLLGDSNDRKRIVECEISFPSNVFNFCGETSLLMSAAIVRYSKAVVTSDSSIMHIAAASHRPVVAVWGATTPSFGFSAYKTQKTDCQVEHLWCRPCSRMGSEHCWRGSFKCMYGQDWKQIADVVNVCVDKKD